MKACKERITQVGLREFNNLMSADELSAQLEDLKLSKAQLEADVATRLQKAAHMKQRLLGHNTDFKKLRYDMQEQLTRTDFSRIHLREQAFRVERYLIG